MGNDDFYGFRSPRCDCTGCKMGGRCEWDIFPLVPAPIGNLEEIYLSYNPENKDLSDPPKWNEFLDLVKGQKEYPSE